jgi:SAM-dependent methyltransferase
MTTQSVEEAARFTGSIPENYDHGLGPHIFADYAGELARRVASLQPANVLELAAGTGIVSRKLRDALAAECELTASDLNPPMLEVAKAKFAAVESVHFKQIDATNLELDEASFDVLACQFVVMFFPDIERSYAEACRVLRPGGSYLFSLWDTWETNPFARIVHETVAGFFPDDPPGFYKVPFGYNEASVIRQSLLGTGFAEVTIEAVPLVSKIPSAARFAKGLVFGNPLFEEINTRGGDPEEVCSAVAEALDQQLGAEMPLQALFVHAVKA